MTPKNSNPRIAQAGFTLVELMVGLTIGLLAVMIIIQVISVFEAQQRSTSGSADAQTNGGIALYTIQREMQMAGFPLVPFTNSPLECTAFTYGATGITGIAPALITDGVAAGTTNASDTITIRYGTSAMGGVPTQVSSLVGNAATVGTNLGCSANDITILNTTSTCNLSSVTAISAAGTSPISVTLQNTTGATSGANLACLGSWNEVSYAINQTTGNLDRTAVVNGVSTTTPSVVGVVNIQAQYGISAAAGSNTIVSWVDPTGATWGTTATTPTTANRNLIKAIRIAVVARNANQAPSAVTTACSSLTAAAPTGLCAWEGSATSPAPTISLVGGDANWAKYRYRVFQTIVPLRNVIWSKDTL